MQVLVLIESKTDGGFRAVAGSPFDVAVEAESAEEAIVQLRAILQNRMMRSRLAVLDLDSEEGPVATPPLQLEPIPEDDWFFNTMRECIEENRQREIEAAR